MASKCQICLEDCKKTIHCGFCDFEGCKSCVKESILYSVNDPECPKCNNVWSYEFCVGNINRTFMEKDYRNRRKDILFDVQKSKIPGTMGAVENEIKREELADKSTTLKVVIDDLQKQLRQYQDMLIVNEYEKSKLNRENNIKKIFKKKCPKEDCAGFLSQQHKCSVCATTVCEHCNEIILENFDKGYGGGESKHKEHECNPDAVASYKMIKEETKPCPNCATAIYKIDGCDQMWCTSCHVAFSWKTGQRVSGRIHNPHFYDWKKNNEEPNREVGEILCGGVIDIRIIHNLLRKTKSLKKYYGKNHNLMSFCHDREVLSLPIFKNLTSQIKFLTHMTVLHREITHFQEVELDKYRRICNEQDPMFKSRIAFIRGKITEKKFKSQIIRSDNINRKSQLILNILEMFYVTFLETYNDMCDTIHKEVCDIEKPKPTSNETYWQLNKNRFIEIRDKITWSIDRMGKLINYSNKELWEISKIYNQTVPIINFPNVVNKKYNDNDFQCYAEDGISKMQGKTKNVKIKGELQERYFNNSKWFNIKMGIWKWETPKHERQIYTSLNSLIDLSSMDELNKKSKNVAVTNVRTSQEPTGHHGPGIRV